MVKLKNRYYIINKDHKPYAYIRVKKDFYTEGILIENKSVLLGYFQFYDSFKAFVLDNSRDCFEKYLYGIFISNENNKNILNLDVGNEKYRLYQVDMDEYFDVLKREEIADGLQIKLIEDKDIIKDIDYLIRNSIRNLNSIFKSYYDYLKNHRYGNLKELIGDLNYYLENDGNNEILEDLIFELKEYLDVLNPINKKLKCNEKLKKSLRKE